ncbi:serine phosphatase RsbU (regulator of sigma subunit) [Streptomyces sp. 2333.5]|nr:serine phosphatase RsbU (regulator of sigma subunit) [Streptomyces sp. 2333.5]SEE72716.1 Serine phosphatase RsbU, regulator of sigma subunit [Streptomyces sp. 2314.4]SEE97209.1 Serine phosphatase RsbU, regulator of sigma subunit [Streptomyces sp. 2112.2]SOE10305.1 Serine phosphatase RsbU, regulator of sigma subunit [Streptomyces sp. 2323.1]
MENVERCTGSRVLAALPYAVMAVVSAVDLTAGPGVGFLPLVSLGPAFAGLVGGWRRTAVVGLTAFVLCVGLGVSHGEFVSRRGLTALLSVAGVTAAGVVAAVMRQRREAELASVRSIAEVAQRVLLRPVPRSAGPLRIAVSYTSAVAEARIGGDLYEVVTSPAGVRIIVGDVQGKGLEAVESAAVVLGAFREAAHDEPDLPAVGERVERALNRHLAGERFVTAVLAEIGDGPQATLLNFGHPAPLVVRPAGAVAFAAPPDRALPLGLTLQGAGAPAPYEVPFAPGDQMLFYTDGVTEARDAAGRFYPLDERAALLKDPDPEAALRSVREDLVEHAEGPLHDDAAMLLVRHREEW